MTYWGLRSYGDDENEIGTSSLKDYITDMLHATDEIWRVLRQDGLLWLNIGDTASGSGGAGGDYNKGGSKQGQRRFKQGDSGLGAMQWCNVPARLSVAMQDNGWLLRQTIVWDKGGMRPEDLSHARRPGVSHEYIFMFAKHRSHRFFSQQLVERGNVWHFPASRGNGHAAPFPVELPNRCIRISTLPGDIVLDPFSGSGTTLRAAHALGRKGIGLDIYEFRKTV